MPVIRISDKTSLQLTAVMTELIKSKHPGEMQLNDFITKYVGRRIGSPDDAISYLIDFYNKEKKY